jgi:hypothetical protein
MMLSRIKGRCAGKLGGRNGGDWGKSLIFNRSERLIKFTELMLLSLKRARVREHPPAGHGERHRFRQP